MKVVKTYNYSHLAHLDYAKLTDEGIEAIIIDDNIVTMNIAFAQAVGGIKLMVVDSDYEKACRVLNVNEYELLKNEFYPHELESQNICPACGSINISRKGSWWSLIGLLIFYPLDIKQKRYVCRDCKWEWGEER